MYSCMRPDSINHTDKKKFCSSEVTKLVAKAFSTDAMNFLPLAGAKDETRLPSCTRYPHRNAMTL